MATTTRRAPEPDFGELLITMRRIARAAGWETRRVKRVLLAAGATMKLGGRHYTTHELLRERLPKLHLALRARLEALEGEDLDDEDEL